MASIRTYEGEIQICTSCGQPAYLAGPDDELAAGMWCHFREQWDGIQCPQFPLAGKTVEMDWAEESLNDLRKNYPDSWPTPARIRHAAI